MKKTLILILIGIALVAASFAGGAIWTRNRLKSAVNAPAVRTVIQRDTVRQTLPKPIKEVIVKERIVEVPLTDTVHVYHVDTLYIGVPYEVKEYRDSNYYAKVGGYRPELLEIETYNTRIVNNVTLSHKWGIGLQGGIGIGYSGGFVAVPYVGVGISYDLFRF